MINVPTMPEGDEFNHRNLVLLRARLKKMQGEIEAEIRELTPPWRWGARNLPRRGVVKTAIMKKLRRDRGRPAHMQVRTADQERYDELSVAKNDVEELILDIENRLPHLPRPKQASKKRVPPPEISEFL